MSSKNGPQLTAGEARAYANRVMAARRRAEERRIEQGRPTDLQFDREMRSMAADLQKYADATESVVPYHELSEGFGFFSDVATRKDNPLAKARLDQFYAIPVERYAVSTGTLGGVVPAQLPPYVAEAVAYGVRSAAPLAAALEILPMPKESMNVSWAKVTTGATVGVQNGENTTDATSADLVVASAQDAIKTVSATADFSAQSRERSGGWFDIVIGYELGHALGTELETLIWSGTGSSGQFKGFCQMTGNSSESVAGQTLANITLAIAGQYNAIANNLGVLPDLIAMAPRRYAYLQSLTAALGLPVENVFPASVRDNVIVSPAAPTNLGAGTNEDWILLLNRASTPLVQPEQPTVEFHQEGPSAGTNLTWRYIIREYVTLGVSRRPEGVGLVKGATTPSL